MKVLKYLLIYVPSMTAAALFGVLVVYLIMDKRVEEGIMAVTAVIGFVGGLVIGLLKGLRK